MAASRTKKPASSNRANQAEIIAAVGVTGAGKTTFVMKEIRRRKLPRLMVWDTKGEFAREGFCQPVTKISEVSALLIKAGASGRLGIAYRPSGSDNKKREDFGRFCELAFHAKNLGLVTEELAEVTQAGWAPHGWRICTTQGRSEGLSIWSLTQSPAWVDKQFFGNCTRIRTGRIFLPAHVKTMSEIIGVPKDEIVRLADGEYIELNVRTREVTRGSVFKE